MSIQYTYSVLKVDESARVMEVIYTAAGRQTMHVGARLPYVGESLESVVEMYSPVAYWLEQEAQVAAVSEGATGTIGAIVVQTLASAKEKKKTELALSRYHFEVSGVVVNGVNVSADRQTQASIYGTHAAMQAGMLQSVNWKTADGTFIALDASGIAAVAQAVTAHVQSAFNLEKQLVAQVEAATTIEAVEDIKWPQ